MTNMKNHQIYSDNFVLNVVDLSCINLATDEDKTYHIDSWARLFKATTWEEVKQMAATNKYLKEASKSIFQFNTEEQIRKMCLDREEYYLDLNRDKQTVAEQDAVIRELKTAVAQRDDTIRTLKATINVLQANINELYTLVPKTTP